MRSGSDTRADKNNMRNWSLRPGLISAHILGVGSRYLQGLKIMRFSFIITICIAAGLLTGAGLLYLFPQIFGLPSTPGSQVVSSGKALIGGPFTLVDHHGNTVSEKSYQGKLTLVYFGYTFCPDVCPTELQVISSALDMLGEKASTIQPIFITVDPERDTVALMADYVTHFHESFVGLTGTVEQIKSAAKAYRVYYSKAKSDAPDEDYLVDHSSIIYLMNRQGKFIKHFNFGIKPPELATELKKYL